MQPPRLSRLPPESTASTFPFRRRRGTGCTVRKEDEEEARNAAAAAAAGRPAPRGRCPRGCSQALRGALGRGRRRLSSPSPEPGLASQRLNSQTSIMAAASERRELSAAASQRPNVYPAAVHKESRHITARRPARPLRRRAGSPGASEPEGRREADGPRRGREGQGRGCREGAEAAAPGASAESPTGRRTEHAQYDCLELARACFEAPACSCTCCGCFCSSPGWGERAEPRPKNPATGRVGCCEGERGSEGEGCGRFVEQCH